MRLSPQAQPGWLRAASGPAQGTPRTRQSPLTLAAFRPWGSSQDRRRAGSIESLVLGLGLIARLLLSPFRPASSPTWNQSATASKTLSCAQLPWPTEDSPSGLWRSPGTRVGLTALAGSNPASSAQPGVRPGLIHID